VTDVSMSRAVSEPLFKLPTSVIAHANSLSFSAKLSEQDWLEVGRKLGRAGGTLQWWIGDWWAYGEHRYGDRKAIVEAVDWDGPALQTCMNCATVTRAFWETSRRREVLPHSHHAEVAALPSPEADLLLNEAEAESLSRNALRERVKQVKAYLAQGWTADQRTRKEDAEKGLCVVANKRLDDTLLAWAAAGDRLIEADRSGPWGNPFIMGEDGDRAEVIAKFKTYYWPHKTKLQSRLGELRGKVLACWCHPEPCHGHVIAEAVNNDP
jgi:Domain of unknown function (DUF4326)